MVSLEDFSHGSPKELESLVEFVFFFFLLFSVFLVEDLLSFCFYELLYFFTYHQKNNFSLKTSRERES